MALPLPSPPDTLADPIVGKWMNDITNYLQSLQKDVTTLRAIPRVVYAQAGTIRQNLGQLVLIPDHPSGPSIIVWDGTQFSRYTAAGVL